MSDLDVTLLRRHIARLLAPWRGEGPGVTVGVVQGGDLAVHESAGLANIELGVPIGPDTTFRIASVSKQFTCAAVLLLAEEGHLAVDDDIRIYLPELAEYGATVTIDQLMRNTSGLRDMLEIMRLGGTDLAVPVTPDDLMAGICRQRALNFAPGSRYLYSNTNFLLLGRIVERLAGEPLRGFLERRLFAPCGMTMTRMVERTSELVPGLATGYLPAPPDGGIGPWVRAQHGFPLHGEGALVSSVIDLALWHHNATTGRVGGRYLADALAATAPLTGGSESSYARGLQVTTVRGVGTISHGGLWPGYRTDYLRIPELDAAIIVIANSGAANPYEIGQQILGALLDARHGVQPAPRLPEPDVLARHVGRFLEPDGPATVDIALSEAGLFTCTTNGLAFTMRASGDGRLAAARTARDFTLRLAAGGAMLAVEQDAGVVSMWRRVAAGALPPADLPGVYHCAEMAASWTIAAGPDGMRVRVAGPVVHGMIWDVEGIDGDVVRFWTPGMLNRSWLDVRVVRDAAGDVNGLVVNGGRVKRLAAQRMEDTA